jgi:ribose-phosphate pyrophosphokinase
MRKLTLDLTGINTINVIEYKISKFPDGQQTIDIQDTIFHPDDVITIKSRLNNFKHLELIICANQALKNLGVKDIELYVPYFVGGRSDRKFQVGGVHYLKQVIAPIINLQGFSKVTVMDPHSDVLESVLNNYEKISNFNLIKWSLSKIDNKNGAQDRVTLISPDAGAYKKIFDVAQHFKIPNVITANKVRDVITGEIVKTEVPVSVYDAGKTFVIIDDICDGGRTFLEIAKAIRSTLSISSVSPEPCKIYLIVTHGIFSKSFLELSQHIDGIFSTNSVRDIDCEEDSQYTVSAGYLQQYNVF